MDEASGMDNFINLRLDGVEVAFSEGEDIRSWKPPSEGFLSFDYVATKRVPKEAKAQRHEVNQGTRGDCHILFVMRFCIILLAYSILEGFNHRCACAQHEK